MHSHKDTQTHIEPSTESCAQVLKLQPCRLAPVYICKHGKANMLGGATFDSRRRTHHFSCRSIYIIYLEIAS